MATSENQINNGTPDAGAQVTDNREETQLQTTTELTTDECNLESERTQDKQLNEELRNFQVDFNDPTTWVVSCTK